MITPGHQYRYTARRGKLARKHGQTVTVLRCHRVQILVRFPNGRLAHIQRRFLRSLPTA